MPLRSVEAATRDDAIAAAREQFGPSVRVVGVRRVRSGGVLGFFATERYVAEVANDPAGRPAVPTPAAGRLGDSDRAEEPAAGYTSSPLSAAAPATAAPSSAGARSRAVAPSRNGAAAWAAAAGTPALSSSSSPSYSSSSSGADEERVSELAGLLGAESGPATPPATPMYGRTSVPRTPAARPAAPVVFPAEKTVDDSPFVEDYVASRPLLRVDEVTAAPSPFTAALARMVSGDRDVREAVENALDKPAIKRARTDAEPAVSQSSSPRSDNTSVPSRSARQEEETVGDQVIAPPAPEAPFAAELPNWAVEPEAAAGGSPREEAIAEVLRSALAQGHSDEALAGILRKVLAGDSPQSALSTPVVALEPAPAPMVEYVTPEPVPAEPEIGAPAMSLAMALAGAGATLPQPEPELVVEETVAAVFATPVEEPAVEESAVVEPEAEIGTAFEAPIDATSAYETPATEMPAYLTPGYEVPGYEVPVFPLPPVLAPASYVSPSSIWGSASDSIWGPSIDSIWGGGTSSETPLWGHSGSNRPAPFTESDAPIWDSVARAEQASSNDDAADAVADLPVFDAVSTPTAADEDGLFAEPTNVEEIADVKGEAADEVVEATPEVTDSAEFVATEDVATEDITAEDAGADDISVDDDVLVASDAESDEAATARADEEVAVLAPVLARTASDPAPMSLDATTVMPPLSLLPPLPGSRPSRGRPPVPPSTSRRQARTTQPHAPSTAPMSAASAAPSVGAPAVESEVPEAQAPAEPAESPLATVTRLPVAPLMAVAETPDLPDMFAEVEVEATEIEATEVEAPVAVDAPIVDEPVAAEPVVEELVLVEQPVVVEAGDDQPVDVPPVGKAPAAADAAVVEEPAAGQPADIAARLEALGVPGHLLGSDFAADVRARGTYAALTRALGVRLPKAPELPTGPGEVLLVVGPGVETLRAARSLAASLRLDPDRVQWATRGDLAGLAPKGSRVTTVDAAIDRRQDFVHEGTVTIVAVDAPMRTDAYWTAQMLAVWSPTAVWAVVEATRKPEDLGPWINGLPRVDALMVQDTDLSADPAAVLRRVATPVAMIDGGRATAHRWASLLCERLENVRP